MTEPAAGGALRGRLALVTGASRGIGRAIAVALAEAGADLIISGRSPEGLSETAALATSPGTTTRCVQADLGRSTGTAKLVSAVIQIGAPVQILVNNAGIGQGAGLRRISSLLDVNAALWDRMFAIHCRAAFLLMRALIPGMVRAGGGSVINISSRQAYRAAPGSVPYGPAKAALVQLTRVAAREFGGAGLRANVLHPGGPVRTSIFNPWYPEPPARRMLAPEIMGPPAVWLAAELPPAVNGRVIDARRWRTPTLGDPV